MNNELFHFDFYSRTYAPYQKHSRTSRAAAKAAKPSAATLRRKVLAYITAQGERGATDEETQDALGMAGSTQRPRRIECQRAGLVVQRGTRPGRSGRQMAVWIATSKEQP